MIDKIGYNVMIKLITVQIRIFKSGLAEVNEFCSSLIFYKINIGFSGISSLIIAR
jgi:hypothetical protein